MHNTTALKKPENQQKITGALYDNAELFGGRVRLIAFGRFYDTFEREENWTTTPLQKPGDGQRVDCSLTRHLPAICEELRVREILSPSATNSNARMCRQDELSARIRIGNKLILRRGVKADGCRLLPGQAYGLSPAGCEVILGWYPGDPVTGEKSKLDVAHASLRSLIDMEEVMTGEQSRQPSSITEAMLHSLNCLGKKNSRRKRVQIIIAFPIPWQELKYEWNYPDDGEKNKKICRFVVEHHGGGCLPGEQERGHIDIAEITTQQFVNLGVPLENINLITCEYFSSLRHMDGKEKWYSTRGVFPDRRNWVQVTRYA